ncbi:MAG: carboxylating nicotinate-nucleotide diphosphorylase [Candidatus Cloacimonetes bacterium]|nr:carboxylating nicotinate-nucleotide diphosphorylase [Candidatus Cloacimonadota bacterium]
MNIDKIIDLSLEEDIGHGDITTENLCIEDKNSQAFIIAKEKGVLAGLNIAFEVFKKIDNSLKCESFKNDGDRLQKWDQIALITGSSSSILQAERVALNFLQRLSGIASLTRDFTEKIVPYEAKLLDTRKTTPLLRKLEKYAVRIGGGYNHRFGLYDMIMLKENHIRAAGSISNAVRMIKKKNTSYKIEVEVTNLAELEEAVENRVDRVMLDNMSLQDMKNAVTKYGDEIELEASGNVTLKTIHNIAATGVQYISCGSLTHSYKSLDISLLFEGKL